MEEKENGAAFFKSYGIDTGSEFVKKIRPIGIVFFLVLFIVFLIICFMSGLEPIKDYEAPHDSEYYAANPVELKTELEENFFPYIDGVKDSTVSDGKLVIVTEGNKFIQVRSALLWYYDEDLFEFVQDGSLSE